MADPIPRGPFDEGLFLTHLNKGREAFESHRYEEAERQLEEAYLLRPRDVRVLNLLGLVYFRAEKLPKAEEVYRKLILQSPEASTLYHNLGLICFKLGRFDDAEQAFLKALELTDGNPKIHFYLGSIYERLQRYKDAIYQYRQAGANLMVQRLQGKLDSPTTLPPPPDPSLGASPDATTPARGTRVLAAPGRLFAAAGVAAAALRPAVEAPVSLSREEQEDLFAFDARKQLHPVSTALLAADAEASAPPRPTTAAAARPTATVDDAVAREVFRTLERGLLEVECSGKVFIRQGTVYSYSGNLTFWVKDKRPGAPPSLVIVTGSGRLILSDHDRETTFLPVAGEPVLVSPDKLLACEESLQPRFARLGEGRSRLEMIALEGTGTAALSLHGRPLPLVVRPGAPASVPAASLVAWSGALDAQLLEDTPGLVRLEGSGRVLLEQTAS
jgi:hypothetical protein